MYPKWLKMDLFLHGLVFCIANMFFFPEKIVVLTFKLSYQTRLKTDVLLMLCVSVSHCIRVSYVLLGKSSKFKRSFQTCMVKDGWSYAHLFIVLYRVFVPSDGFCLFFFLQNLNSFETT